MADDTENSDLYASSRHDPVMRRFQKQMLEQLSKNTKNPVLAEMAQEILGGKLTPRQAMATPAYADSLMSAGAATLSKHMAMSEEEKAAAVEAGRAALDELDAQTETDRQQDTEANPPGQRSTHAPADDMDDGEPLTWYEARPAAPGAAEQDEEASRAETASLPRSMRDRANRS